MESGPLLALKRAAAELAALLPPIAPGPLTAATPCAEWDLRALLNHVVRGTLMYCSVVRATSEPDRTLDYLGDDAGFAFASASDEFAALMAAPGALERRYEGRRGPISGERLVGMRMVEYLVHGGDVAIATGQPYSPPDALVDGCIALALETETARPREAGGPYAAALPVSPGAPSAVRLAAFFGRQP